MIILYSTGCPKCKILKQKLDEQNIEYTICSDVELMKEKGFTTVPMLEIDGKIYSYIEAMNYIKESI